MQKYRWLTLGLGLIFLSGALATSLRHHFSGDAKKETDALKYVLPEADRFSPKEGTPPHYTAYKTDTQSGQQQLAGVAFVTTDLFPNDRGYAGPIKILIGLDPQGTVTNVKVLAHSETPSYVLGLDDFMKQFLTKNIHNRFKLGVDIDGITRATVTSDAIATTVGKSIRRAAREVLKLSVAEESVQPKPVPADQIVVPVILFIIALAGVLTRRTAIRWTALVAGLLYLGFIKSTMMSTVQLANIGLWKLPDAHTLPLWYLIVIPTVLTTLIFGNIYCGSLCPFASIQEWLFKLSGKSRKPRRLIPSPAVDERARTIKYGILFSALITSFAVNNSSAAGIEPFLTLFTHNGSFFAWGLLGIALVLALVNFRFWCKYLCPVGAFNGLLARKSLFQIKLGTACDGCKMCEIECPTNAITMNADSRPVVNAAECIVCTTCIRICPQKTLFYQGTRHAPR